MRKAVDEIKQICLKIFQKKGLSIKLARIWVKDLILNDIEDCSSHGVIRIKEYISHFEKGYVIPKNKPIVSKLSDFVYKIDGNRSIGPIVKQEITNQLLMLHKKNKFGFVTLHNSSHIGRLNSIAKEITNRGGLILGFLNSAGSGQIVVPFGGTFPKLSTNPILLASPSAKGPIIIDFSTSSYSEGKLRTAYYKNQRIPEEIIIDKNGESFDDPAIFYKRIKEIFLTPLGGKNLGYKGFGLSLFTEILSGILSGGVNVSENSTMTGNDGFFITFAPELFGINIFEFNLKVSNLIEYIQSSGDPKHRVRIPGLRHKTKIEKCLDIPEKLYNELLEMLND